MTSVRGSAWNSSQVHLPRSDPPSCRASVHRSSGVSGVGPALRTGKSSVRYWPGGSLFRSALAPGRPVKPLVVIMGGLWSAGRRYRRRNNLVSANFISGPIRSPLAPTSGNRMVSAVLLSSQCLKLARGVRVQEHFDASEVQNQDRDCRDRHRYWQELVPCRRPPAHAAKSLWRRQVHLTTSCSSHTCLFGACSRNGVAAHDPHRSI